MPVVMMLYYALSVYLLGILIWSFIREKQSVSDMVLYLVLATPLILRVLHIK
jgi:hypothetical protein